MQKKRIALFIAGVLAAAPALAESKLDIYGVIDMSVVHRTDAVKDGIDSKTAFESGSWSGDRLGFKGTEDLGGGLKALFVLEAGFAADDGNQKQSGRLFGRQAYLGLTGDFGTLLAGRQKTLHYAYIGDLDPVSAIGEYRNVRDVGIKLKGERIFDIARLDNAVSYVTPKFAGFNLSMAYATNGLAQEGTTALTDLDPGITAANKGNDGDARVFALLPRYQNGPLDIALSWHSIAIKKFDLGNALGEQGELKINNWALGGTYDFGPAILHAFYDVSTLKKNDSLVAKKAGFDRDDLSLKAWMLGVSVPVGKHLFAATYNQSDLEQQNKAKEGKTRQWALSYKYSLSKRTTAYATYVDIANDDGRSVGTDGYQRGYQIGLRHKF